jgi:hypothetical protein
LRTATRSGISKTEAESMPFRSNLDIAASRRRKFTSESVR